MRESFIEDLTRFGDMVTSADLLRAYSVYNPVLETARRPLWVLKPRDVPSLQQAVRRSREEKFGLVTVSSGGPHLRGGTACTADHGIIDLSAWKKIPWVNRRNRVCIVEPGVTYGEVNEFLKGEGMTLPAPLAPRSTKSVLASTVDREPHTWPRMQWDLQDPVASTEFIFGTGELFRSGAAGGPGSLEEQRKSKGAQKMPMGPGQTDFQRIVIGSQGSMGIMTWISLRTELLPSIERPMMIASDRLDRITGYVYEAQRPWLGEETFILNRTAAAMLMSQASPDDYGRIRNSLPGYICLQNIAGFERLPRERLEYQYEELMDMAGKNGLSLSDSAGEIDARALLHTARTPSDLPEWRHGIRGHCLSVFFLSTLNRTESFIPIAKNALMEHNIEEELLGIYLQPIVQNHGCHMEFMLPFNPGIDSEVERTRAFESDLTDRLMKAGAFFSRPYGRAAKTVWDNNRGNTGLIKVIKEIFDPENILNPGKFPFLN